MFPELQLRTQEHSVLSPYQCLGEMQLLPKELGMCSVFPEQHWLAAWTLWAGSDDRAPESPWLPAGPSHPGTWAAALSSCTSTPLMAPGAHGAFVCKPTSSGSNLHLTGFSLLGFFSEANPVTEMPITALNQCKGTGRHRVGNARHKATSAPWTASCPFSSALLNGQTLQEVIPSSLPTADWPKTLPPCSPWECAFIKWPRLCGPWLPLLPTLQQSRAAARTHSLLLQGMHTGQARSEEVMEFASLAFFGCCCSQTSVNSPGEIWLLKICFSFGEGKERKKKVTSPAGRGAAHLTHTLPQGIILSFNQWL